VFSFFLFLFYFDFSLLGLIAGAFAPAKTPKIPFGGF
jgi:hypothetical protein